jgi:oligopeptide transport system substrate-binding protein
MDSLKLNFQEGDLPSLHPHALMIYLRGISVAKNLYECLTRIDSEGKPQLAGAESVEISSDHLRYTFKLRKNHWSDGTPVTAYQFESAWKEALSPTSSCSRADLLYMIKNAEQAKRGELPIDSIGVKALDSQTLSVELDYPSPYFLELAAQPISAPLVDPKNKEPSEFNGPFLVDSRKHGDYLKLKKNPHYWDNSRVMLKQIDIYMVQDTMTAFSMFEKGKIDWIGVPFVPLSKEILDSLEKTNNLQSHPIDRVFWVFLNTEHPSLSSPSIRQALSLAVDRSAITDHILAGGRPLEKPLPSSILSLQPSLILEKNLAEAKIRFEQGLGEIGHTKETFPSFVIAYSQQAGRKQLAEYLQQTWSKAFGIKVKVEAQEWNVLRSNLEKGLFDISGCYEAAFYNDPMELLGKLLTLNPNNFSKWVDQDFKQEVVKARQEQHPEKRQDLLAKAEEILMKQMPFIPISSDVFKYAHHPNLKGYIFDYVGACDFSHATLNTIN